MTPFKDFHNEDGSVLVVVLIMIALLTLMGMSATTNSTLELQIAGAGRDYQESFYKAEAAAMQGGALLEDAEATELTDKTVTGLVGTTDMTLPANWTTSNEDAGVDGLANLGETQYAIMDIGIAGGSSLDMSASNLHEYKSLGYHESKKGRVLVEIGYLKRF